MESRECRYHFKAALSYHRNIVFVPIDLIAQGKVYKIVAQGERNPCRIGAIPIWDIDESGCKIGSDVIVPFEQLAEMSLEAIRSDLNEYYERIM